MQLSDADVTSNWMVMSKNSGILYRYTFYLSWYIYLFLKKKWICHPQKDATGNQIPSNFMRSCFSTFLKVTIIIYNIIIYVYIIYISNPHGVNEKPWVSFFSWSQSDKVLECWTETGKRTSTRRRRHAVSTLDLWKWVIYEPRYDMGDPQVTTGFNARMV